MSVGMEIQQSCPVCGNADGNGTFTAREMMFGTHEAFVYGECKSCGSVWLLTRPDDLSRYYGPTYYAHRQSALRRWVRLHPTAYRLAHLVTSGHFPAGIPEWWPEAPPRLDATVLDVGSGTGNFLLHLKYLGFSRLAGIDPYIDKDVEFPGGPVILKRAILEVEGTYDIVVLNHSFEHMEKPHDVFHRIAQLIGPKGCAVIRTPVAGSFAYRTYGADWVQLDPPRHLVIPTTRSISILAKQHGLEVCSVKFDSTGFQFAGSELYRRGIPLVESRSLRARLIKGYDSAAHKLNEQQDGDQASFVLRKPQ